MIRFIAFADSLSAWFGKAFGWLVIMMTLGMSYEVFVRYALNGRPRGHSTYPSSCTARFS